MKKLVGTFVFALGTVFSFASVARAQLSSPPRFRVSRRPTSSLCREW